MRRGRMDWMPAPLVDEIEDIKRENRKPKPDAIKDLVRYCRNGREIERMLKLNWNRAKRLPPLDSYSTGGRPKKKKKGQEYEGIF